jgi:hypothetical protein
MSSLHIIAPAYQYYPILLPSLLAQTNPDWSCHILHDGPNQEYEQWVAGLHDDRIHLTCTEERRGLWGHPLRQLALACEIDSEYLVVSNADNYYTPNWADSMLRAVRGQDCGHCDMLHSHHKWRPMVAEIAYCKIDCGAFMVRTTTAQAVGWPWTDKDSDWTFIEACCQRSSAIVRVPNILFVHN